MLYGGMAADVTFVIDSAEDVLYVSKKAVFEEEGHSYVYKKDANGNRVKTQVETGFSDTASIEIISGLEEGDVIYIESVMNINSEKAGKEDYEPDYETVVRDDESDGFPGMNGETPDMENGFPAMDGGFEAPGEGGPMGNMPGR